MKCPGNYLIRAPIFADLDALVLLCKEHAEYEGWTYEIFGKKDSLKTHLFSETPSLQCLVVELDDQLVGYAAFARQFSTWHARYYLHLDCLYLRLNERGRGLGRAIMEYIRNYASAQKMSHVEWQTPVENKEAIHFYERLGATSKSKIRFYFPIEFTKGESKP